MAKKKALITNAMRHLQASGIEFETIEYECDEGICDDFGMMISEKTGIPPVKSFKTLVVRGDKKGVMVACIPVCCEVDLKKLASAADDKSVQMIHVKELLGLTGYIRGGVSPIGMKKKYPTFIDESCLGFDKIAVSGGVCGATLLIKPQDVITECDATACDIVKK